MEHLFKVKKFTKRCKFKEHPSKSKVPLFPLWISGGGFCFVFFSFSLFPACKASEGTDVFAQLCIDEIV